MNINTLFNFINNFFYNKVRNHNLHTDNIFKATYTYGPKEEQIHKKNIIWSLFERLIIFPFKNYIYPGAYAKDELGLDQDRIKRGKNALKRMGGQSIKMQTPDGDVLDGMYIKTPISSMDLEHVLQMNKEHLSQMNFEKYFDSEEIVTDDGSVYDRFTLKNEFYTKQNSLALGEPCIYYKPTEEASKFLHSLKKSGLGSDEFLGTYRHRDRNGNYATLELDCFGFALQLVKRPRHFNYSKYLLVSDSAYHPNKTALITGGIGIPYSFYKKLAAYYLARGINVMMFDFRGDGDSIGHPTSHKTKLDMETVYQYLQTVHGVSNQELIIHGYCFGAGSALDLAARRKGTNLLIDRSFSNYANIVSNSILELKTFRKIPKIQSMARYIVPWIVDYDNAANISRLEGNIAILMAEKDDVIPKSETIKLINSLPNTKKGQVIKLMNFEGGHYEKWYDKKNATSLQFDQFLSQSGLL